MKRKQIASAADAEVDTGVGRSPAMTEQPPFDPATLPSIESITAGSDIRAFLQSGVPAELTKAALRRAWTTDPAIRDFIGMAENQWDFTDPTAMPGFGPLQAGDDVGRARCPGHGKAARGSSSPAPANMAARATGRSNAAQQPKHCDSSSTWHTRRNREHALLLGLQ